MDVGKACFIVDGKEKSVTVTAIVRDQYHDGRFPPNMTCLLCKFIINPPAPICNNVSCQICVEVAKIDEEVDQIVATLARLRDRHDELLSEQNRTHDLVLRLPLELKSHIFELVLPTREEWDRGLKGRMPPHLTSICKGWRDIAWSIPVLWSTIPIVLGKTSTYDSSLVKFVHKWILRSRNLPLTLHIQLSNFRTGCKKSEKQLFDVFEVMSRYPNQWRSLSLEIPYSLLHIFHDGVSDFQSHLLTIRRLGIRCTDDREDIDQPIPPSNAKMNPEEIEIYGLSFQSLHLSWNHLTSVTVGDWDLGDVTQLFQHASQMTYCNISQPRRSAQHIAMPPIVHERLQTLALACSRFQEIDLVLLLLNSITLPCLRAIETDLEVAADIPALVHRSSCSLTRVTFVGGRETESFQDLRPLPGVTDLVLEIITLYDEAVLKKLLLEGYFPDLLHLTLRQLNDFFVLWVADIIPILLGPRSDKVKLCKIFVQGADTSHPMWNLKCGKQVKAIQSGISWREGAFEISIPEFVSSNEDGPELV